MEANNPVLCSSKPLKPDLENFQRIPITSEVFKLGRGHQNTLIMPSKCLSKDHCVFKKVDDDWILENCSYANIKVNGNKVRKGQKHKLHDKDIIKLENTNELVYTFNKSPPRKRRKLGERDENIQKKSLPEDKNCDQIKQQIMTEQSQREKQIYNEYATRIERLRGSKRTVKQQKGQLKTRRDTQLTALKWEMERKMAALVENSRQKDTGSQNPTEEPLKLSIQSESSQGGPKEESLHRLRAKIREQDRVRLKEKKELRKLRKETEQLRLEKEKKLKELEKQKRVRETELQEELKKVNMKLAKQIELHESEKRRAERLQKEKKPEPTAGDSMAVMESELQCSICSELFVQPTTLGCAHSFCRYCVCRWRRTRQECPICRANIVSECRSIVLDSLVEKVAGASEEAKRQREELLKTRAELEAKEATTASSRESSGNHFIDDYSNNYMRELYDYENSSRSSNSTYYGRESSLEPEPDLLVEMEGEESEEFSPDENSDSDNYYNYEDSAENEEESTRDPDESAPEDDEAENLSHDDEAENLSHDDEAENLSHDDEAENLSHDDEAENLSHDDEAENLSHDDEAENLSHDDEAENLSNDDEAENSQHEIEGEISDGEIEGDSPSEYEPEPDEWGEDNDAPEDDYDENSYPDNDGDEYDEPNDDYSDDDNY